MVNSPIITKYSGDLDLQGIVSSIDYWIDLIPTGAMCRERWFADKGKEIASLALKDCIPFKGSPVVGLICLIEVNFVDAAPHLYQVPLVVSTEHSIVTDDGPPFEICIEAADATYFLRQPGPGDGFWQSVLRALQGNEELEGRGGVLRFRTFQSRHKKFSHFFRMASEARNAICVRDLGRDQSNSSIVVGEASLFKLYRRIEAGLHPELELYHFLCEKTDFTGVPLLEGWMEYSASDGSLLILGLLQAFVRESVDGWSALIEGLRDTLQRGTSPVVDSLPSRLGDFTAELHLALAQASDGGGLGTAKIDSGTIRNMKEMAIQALGHCVEALPTTSSLAEGLIIQVTHTIDALDLEIPAGRRARIHGDYHLGQILCHGNDLYVVDFEGEPARPISERRTQHSPLKDVAGMLRSFSYAMTIVGDEECREPVDMEHCRAVLIGWERIARKSFLDAYWAKMDNSRQGRKLLPDVAHRHRLLTFFELEKALYELLYECRNRPEYAWIPMRGISDIVG